MFRFKQTIIREPTVCVSLAEHVGAFIVNLNENFNILKQFNCALVGQIRDLIRIAVVQKYHFHHEFHRDIGEIVLAEITAVSVPPLLMRFCDTSHLNTPTRT
jgi:hypothetical protein